MHVILVRKLLRTLYCLYSGAEMKEQNYPKLYSPSISNADCIVAFDLIGTSSAVDRTVVVVVSRYSDGRTKTNRSSWRRCFGAVKVVVSSASIMAKIFVRSSLSSSSVSSRCHCGDGAPAACPTVASFIRLTFGFALAKTMTLLFNNTSDDSMTQPNKHKFVIKIMAQFQIQSFSLPFSCARSTTAALCGMREIKYDTKLFNNQKYQ